MSFRDGIVQVVTILWLIPALALLNQFRGPGRSQ